MWMLVHFKGLKSEFLSLPVNKTKEAVCNGVLWPISVDMARVAMMSRIHLAKA